MCFLSHSSASSFITKVSFALIITYFAAELLYFILSCFLTQQNRSNFPLLWYCRFHRCEVGLSCTVSTLFSYMCHRLWLTSSRFLPKISIKNVRSLLLLTFQNYNPSFFLPSTSSVPSMYIATIQFLRIHSFIHDHVCFVLTHLFSVFQEVSLLIYIGD